MRVVINNEEVLCDKSLTINEEVLTTSSTILRNCYPRSWEDTKDYTQFYYPEDYSKCLIYNDNDELIFCGCVKRTGNINLRPFEPHYCDLEVLDFKTLLSEGQTLEFVITDSTVPQAIARVVEEIKNYGFVVGEIKILDEDTPIGNYSTLDKTAYDVFQYLADVSQSKWYTRMIDENTIAIDFYDPTLMEKGQDLEYTKQWFIDNDIHDIQYSYTTEDYRNKQIIKSAEVYGSTRYTEEIFTDGYNKEFKTASVIGEVKSAVIDDVVVTYCTKQESELGIEATVIYNPGTTSFEVDRVYPSGTPIVISYIPIIKGRQVVNDTKEIARISSNIGRNGTISRYEARDDVTDIEELRLIAQSYLKYKGKPTLTLTVTTTSNLWNIGEVVDAKNIPIEELNKKYMVKKKTIEIISTIDKIFYTYELDSSFNSESEINYFDNQRAKNAGNIEDGDFIDRNIDITNEVDIQFINFSIEEAEYTNDNVLNNALNMTLTR